MTSIVVFGASGHARVVIDIVEKEGRYRIAGLIDRAVRDPVFGYPVLGTDDDLPPIVAERGIEGGIVAIGDNWTRRRVVCAVERLVPGFRFVAAVHPSAQVGRDVRIERGAVVMAGAVVNPGATVGEFAIVNTGASLDHDSAMDRYSSLGPKATTGGNVRIGAFSAVCQGANVIHGITVGKHTVVGAGSTVLEDLPDCVVAYGTPARVIRAREAGDRYL